MLPTVPRPPRQATRALGRRLQAHGAVWQLCVAHAMTDGGPARAAHANLLHAGVQLHHLPHVHVQALCKQGGGTTGARGTWWYVGRLMGVRKLGDRKAERTRAMCAAPPFRPNRNTANPNPPAWRLWPGCRPRSGPSGGAAQPPVQRRPAGSQSRAGRAGQCSPVPWGIGAAASRRGWWLPGQRPGGGGAERRGCLGAAWQAEHAPGHGTTWRAVAGT